MTYKGLILPADLGGAWGIGSLLRRMRGNTKSELAVVQTIENAYRRELGLTKQTDDAIVALFAEPAGVRVAAIGLDHARGARR